MERRGEGVVVRTLKGHIEIEQAGLFSDPLADGGGYAIQISADQADVVAKWLQEAKAELDSLKRSA
jgi:hypothetical protein